MFLQGFHEGHDDFYQETGMSKPTGGNDGYDDD